MCLDRCFEDRTCLQQIKKQKVKTCQDEELEQFELSNVNREVAGVDGVGDISFLPNLFRRKTESAR